MCEWFDDVIEEQTALLQDFSQLATRQAEERKVLETVTPEDEETRRRVDQLTRVVERLALTSEEQAQELAETKAKLVLAENELTTLREEHAVRPYRRSVLRSFTDSEIHFSDYK